MEQKIEQIWVWSRRAATSLALLLSSVAGALSLTPGGICKDAGFGKGTAFNETCVSRVYSERRSRAWREQAPFALLGAVGGIAATGGTALGFVSVRGQTGVYRLALDGQTFNVHVANANEATVMSATPFRNMRAGEIDLWTRAAATVSGCAIRQRVHDFDSLYVWTDCADQSQPLSTPVTSTAPQATAVKPTIAEDLARLAQLRDKGALSADEFQSAKARLLAKED